MLLPDFKVIIWHKSLEERFADTPMLASWEKNRLTVEIIELTPEQLVGYKVYPGPKDSTILELSTSETFCSLFWYMMRVSLNVNKVESEEVCS